MICLVCLGWWCECGFGFGIVVLFVICLCAIGLDVVSMEVVVFEFGCVLMVIGLRSVVLFSCFTFGCGLAICGVV